MVIKSILIENNVQALDYLKKMIKEYFPSISIEGSARNIKNGIQLINEVSPELVFLDIELDDGLSFEILEYFNDPTFEVIFVTAFNDYYQKAFEHFAFSYIVKPFRAIDLKKVMDRYMKKRKPIQPSTYSLNDFLRNSDPRIMVYTGKEHISIHIKEIIYCEADGNHTHIYIDDTISSKILVNHSLTYLSNLLSPKGFFRASRFYLINMYHIKSIFKKDYITLSNREKIKVSMRNKESLTELIESFKL